MPKRPHPETRIEKASRLASAKRAHSYPKGEYVSCTKCYNAAINATINAIGPRTTENNREAIYRALAFTYAYPGWQSFATNAPTTRAIHYLASHGFAQINRYRQYRATNPSGTPITKPHPHV